MRHIIPDAITRDVGQGIGLGDVRAGAADDGDELALVVEAEGLLGDGGDGDGIEGPGDGGDGLVEQHRVGGQRHVGLGGVPGVVEAQAAHRLDVGAVERRQQQPHVSDLLGDGVGAPWRPADYLRLRRLADVCDARGQDRVAVVGAAVFGEEADQALGEAEVSVNMDWSRAARWRVCELFESGVVSN